MKRCATLTLALFAALAATAAFAQEPARQDLHWNESPMYGTAGFNVGLMYFTSDDYEDIYGSSGITFYNLTAGWKIVHHLELTGDIGYGFAEGRGVSPLDSGKTAEKFKLHIAPAALGLLYRFNFWLDQVVVPYVGGSGVASYWFEEKLDSSWKRRSYNYGVMGFGGLMFLLDGLEKRASGAMEAEWGINNTYLFYEFRYTSLNNFDAEDIIDLSSSLHTLGILFEF